LDEGGALFSIHSVICDPLTAFNDNEAESGGAMAINDESVSMNLISGCTFMGNSADYGGVFYYVTENVTASSEFIFNNCTFTNSFAIEGGAVYASDFNATFSSCLFNTNEANETGGAIYANNGTLLPLSGSSFVNNVALMNGSAIYLENGAYLISLEANNITTAPKVNNTVETIYCDDCAPCNAATNCSDCDGGCVQFKTNATITSVQCFTEENLCKNDGVCTSISHQAPTCECTSGWKGDTCDSESTDHTTLIIVVSVVGGVVALVIIILAVRAVMGRKRTEYNKI